MESHRYFFVGHFKLEVNFYITLFSPAAELNPSPDFFLVIFDLTEFRTLNVAFLAVFGKVTLIFFIFHVSRKNEFTERNSLILIST